MQRCWLILLFFLLTGCSAPSNFQAFIQQLQQIESSAARQQCVDRYLRKLSPKDYPIFLNDSTVVLLYSGTASQVRMIGDINYWTTPAQFTQIDSTNLHYLKIRINPKSLPEYWLLIDNKTPQIDSLNQYKIKNEFGYVSRIVNHNNPKISTQINTHEKNYKTYLVPTEDHRYVKIHLYFPPLYNDYESYPLALFLEGKKYIELGNAPVIIESLIKEGRLPQFVAAFVELNFDDHTLSIDNFNQAKKIITQEVINFLENQFSLLNNPEKRLIVGKAVTAGLALSIALENPDKFGNVFSQSAYLSAENLGLQELIQRTFNSTVNLYLQIGRYERNVSHLIIPPDETDFYQINQDFAKKLTTFNYSVTLREYYAGHTWGNWRSHLADGLIYFFSKNSSTPG